MLGRLTLAEKVKFRLGLPSTVIQIESIRWHRSPQGMKLEQCVIQCINPQISASEHEVHFLFIQSPKCGHLAHTSRGPFGDSGAFDFMPPPALCPHSTPGFQRHHLAGSEPAEGRASAEGRALGVPCGGLRVPVWKGCVYFIGGNHLVATEILCSWEKSDWV